MHKTIRAAFIGCAALALSAGYAHAQEPLRAEVMHWWTSGGESAAVKVFADAFDAAGGEWVDTATAGGQNARAAAINRIVGGNPPTATQFNTGRQFDDLVSQNLVTDIDAAAKEQGWADVIPEAIVTAASRDGKFYAVPVNIHGQNWMFYNKEVFDKAGISEAPKDFTAFFDAMDKLKESGVTPIAWGGQPWQEALVFDAVLLGEGGKELFLKVYRDKDPEAIRSDAFKKAAETFHRMHDYIDEGAPGRNWNDATNMVITGKAGVQIMGDWAKGDFIAAGMTPGENAGCALVPGETGYVMGGDVFVFPRLGDSGASEAQLLLAKTMLDKDTQLAFNEKKGSIPVRTDVDTSGMDACAQKGAEIVKDKANQIPSVNYLVSADATGGIQDAVTSYFNNPSASVDDFAENIVDALANSE